MNDSGESDATRYFNLQTSRDFSREFLRTRPQSRTNSTFDQEKKIRQLTLQLAEAEATLHDKQKLVELAQTEAKDLRDREKDVYEKYEKAVKEAEGLKDEIGRLRMIERDYNDKKVSGDFLLQSYRTALSKYRSWYEYATKQLEAMKKILEDCGRWTTDNRYQIMFSYRSLPPIMIDDKQAVELAAGSIVDYKGIDDVDSIHNDSGAAARFLNNSTQTDVDVNSSGIDASSSFASDGNSFGRSSKNNSGIKMSGSELQYLELKERMKKMELENIQLKDQLYLARDAAKKASELKEQNRDLSVQVEFLKKQVEAIYDEKEKLAESVQNNIFTDLVGPSKRAESRQIMEKVMEEKERNDTLLRKTVEMEEEINRLKAQMQAESGPSQSSQPSNQTTVDGSVFYCHMKENPFQQAVKEHEERENLKRRRLDDGYGNMDAAKMIEQEEEITKLKQEIEKLNVQKERTAAFHADFARRYRESVRHITGYDVKMRNEEFIEASNVYDLGNHFSFQREGKEMNLLDSEYAQQWQEHMEKYLGQYESLPCFMSAVTLDLGTRHG